MKSKIQYSRLYTRQRKSDFITITMDRRQQKSGRKPSNHRRSSPSPPIERTKTLKKFNYLELDEEFMSSRNKISQRSQQNSLEESVLIELASYMKKKESEGRKYKWEEMLVGGKEDETQYSNKTKTVVNKCSQFQEDYFDDFFDDYDTSANDLDQYAYKQDVEWSNSKTLSIHSSETEFIDSYSSPKVKKEKRGRKSSESSDDSSDLVNFAINHQRIKQTQQEQENKKLREKRFHVNYNEEDEFFEDIWLMIQQREQKSKKDKQKKERTRSGQKFTRSASPPIEEYKFEKKKNAYLHIQSPDQKSKQQNSRRPNIFVVSNQKKNKEQSNSCCHNKRETEYKVKRLKKQKQEEPTCTICLCDIEDRSKLPCKHSFCRQCLIDWVSKTSNCPNCRKPAQFYTFDGTKYPIQQKEYSLQNYVDNIGEDSDDEGELDCQCYNCDDTQEGDELLVCDSCLVNASHVECDSALRGKEPAFDRQWFCHVCRASPNMWYRERRWR